MKTLAFGLCILVLAGMLSAQGRLRDLNVNVGVLSPGGYNAITDVPGVLVGHETIIEGDHVRTGVTAILPHDGNVFQEKVPAAIYVGNGFGKLMGSTQVQELGNLETPIILTNTLSIPTAANAILDYVLSMEGNEDVRSVNALVGETNDGYLNDIRGRHVRTEHIIAAIQNAKSGMVDEGNVGAGTGTVCFGFKGGIGTSSRKLPESLGGYTVGVLVQSNFGGVLRVNGVPVGKALEKYYFSDQLNETADGSCMIVVATDAPLGHRNLERLAKRAMMGLANTGGIASNGSGDYVIAFSTYEKNRILYRLEDQILKIDVLPNAKMSPLFMGVIEATEEAILNSLIGAETMVGRAGHRVESLPLDDLRRILRDHGQ